MSGTVHVIGAGLAGLSAATALAAAGRPVVLYEAASQAGGRCRSIQDAALERTVDNGNHLLLSGNRRTIAYLERLGARDRLAEIKPAVFPFLDLSTGTEWCLRPNAGPLPWWTLVPGRRTPGAGALSHLAALKLLSAPPQTVVTDRIDPASPIYERLWGPMATAVLNLDPRKASAHLLGAVLLRTLLRGEHACRPLLAPQGLSHALIDPALDFLRQQGAIVMFQRRLRALEIANGRLEALAFADERIVLRPGDSTVLAVPPTVAAALVPGLAVPKESCAIVNAHFRTRGPIVLPGGLPFLGLIGGTAEWLFIRDDILSVTVSDAGDLAELPAHDIAERLWADIVRAIRRPEPLPPYRIIKERRATFRQSPEEVTRRPAQKTAMEGLILAGDWTDTGLPATIEGAVLSGERAAMLVLHPSPDGRWLPRFRASQPAIQPLSPGA